MRNNEKTSQNMFSLQRPQGKIDRVETILDREAKHGESKENQQDKERIF